MTQGVPTGPRPPDSHESIKAYLAANDGRFTAAALRTELIRAGHVPERIDAALRRVALGGPGGTPTTRLPPPPTGRLIFGDASGSVRRRIAVWLLRLAHVAVSSGSPGGTPRR